MFRVFPGLIPCRLTVTSPVFRGMSAVQERVHVLGDALLR